MSVPGWVELEDNYWCHCAVCDSDYVSNNKRSCMCAACENSLKVELDRKQAEDQNNING